ncbi:acetylglutamate kinase [Polaribacter tangerinus]|uniref:acetylglutamate kinase n=1 Tax=Polaribacter tangerinus TaxID=1920034 RepID=UPI000B4B2D10|nr:acetylglutamate kinase [Polaribacter tangerinus]
MEKLSIVKIGGNIIEDENLLNKFLTLFAHLKGKKILIHGGGKRATTISKKLGIEPSMLNGRRITDAATLEVITMVYGGLINKNIVAKLQALQTNAIGLTGADANTIISEKRPKQEVDFGYVGDVKKVDQLAINKLMQANFTPVFCAITHDNCGQLLNTNADTVTAQIAISLSKIYETSIYYCFELNGVLENINDTNSVIKTINNSTYNKLLSENKIVDGMIPKLENCINAINKGVQKVYLGNTDILTKNNTNFTTISL